MRNPVVEHSEKIGRYDHPSIEICISKPENDVCIRFRDQGGGISKHDQQRVWEYSFTTVDKDDEFQLSRMQMEQATGGPIAGVSPATLILMTFYPLLFIHYYCSLGLDCQ